jgi:hypothetical protein
MNSVLIALVLFAAVGLIHFAYVDFRFRHRDGVAWFWLGGPAPADLILSRAAVAGAFLAALATVFTGANKTMAFIMVGLMLVHIGSLIVLERRESR